jgi:Zn-dependent peptidase ImmA (M78 family)
LPALDLYLVELVNLNINRLNHLLALFRVTKEELLSKLNEDVKRKLEEKDVFSESIKLSLLKKIDKVFNKGLEYYLDPKNPSQSKEESIFFRKDSFNAKLNLGAKQIVNRFEEEKISFSALSKLIDFKVKRTIRVYNLLESPIEAADEVRAFLYPKFASEKKEFLKNFIAILSEFNILVFEFVEAHNKKEKANINGFFLAPNVIVLKRNQKALRREIFTLAHELGHYLLNEEDIDGNVNNEKRPRSKHVESDVEKWCNDFAYYFLAGQFRNDIERIVRADSSNDYYHEAIDRISYKTHLSALALYTRLSLNGSISKADYRTISESILLQIKQAEDDNAQELALRAEKAKEAGKPLIILPAKPIVSPLYLQTLQGALLNGLISEYDFCNKLRIPVNKLESYLI